MVWVMSVIFLEFVGEGAACQAWELAQTRWVRSRGMKWLEQGQAWGELRLLLALDYARWAWPGAVCMLCYVCYWTGLR